MPTLKELRIEARLSVNQLSKLAEVDRQTVERAESGIAVRDIKAYAIVQALAEKLGRTIALSDVQGLNIL